MGCCLSRRSTTAGHGSQQSDLELRGNNRSVTNTTVCCRAGPYGEAVSVSHDTNQNVFKVSGSGTMLGSCSLDCDTARWEVVIGEKAEGANVQIGVKRFNKKLDNPSKLSGSLSASIEDKESPAWCLQGMESMSLNEGDVLGVYWDQTDLPMLSFTLNGTPLPPHTAVTRVRPSTDVFAAVSVSEGASCTVVFDEASFKFPSISSKFKMIICSSSLI